MLCSRYQLLQGTDLTAQVVDAQLFIGWRSADWWGRWFDRAEFTSACQFAQFGNVVAQIPDRVGLILELG
jgi:hypothetical protein